MHAPLPDQQRPQQEVGSGGADGSGVWLFLPERSSDRPPVARLNCSSSRDEYACSAFKYSRRDGNSDSIGGPSVGFSRDVSDRTRTGCVVIYPEIHGEQLLRTDRIVQQKPEPRPRSVIGNTNRESRKVLSCVLRYA